MLVLKTVTSTSSVQCIYKSKCLDFQNFTSLILDDFKKTLEKKVVSLVKLFKICDLKNYSAFVFSILNNDIEVVITPLKH